MEKKSREKDFPRGGDGRSAILPVDGRERTTVIPVEMRGIAFGKRSRFRFFSRSKTPDFLPIEYDNYYVWWHAYTHLLIPRRNCHSNNVRNILFYCSIIMTCGVYGLSKWEVEGELTTSMFNCLFFDFQFCKHITFLFARILLINYNLTTCNE